jgi:hypothetical protein
MCATLAPNIQFFLWVNNWINLNGILWASHWLASTWWSVEHTNSKHHKIVGIYLITYAFIPLMPDKVHKHICNTLIASIITFSWMDHQQCHWNLTFKRCESCWWQLSTACSMCQNIGMHQCFQTISFPASVNFLDWHQKSFSVSWTASGFIVKHGKTNLSSNFWTILL